ncbi:MULTISPECIES: TldD/PmbA family protein [unclassified Moorena]|uniref:TldD/PmbA family protein n=1 Tax=unclassified Moorena TaxID=2683338 RepID=UPI0014003A42|nr:MULTISPECIES: TldD/PmbA family protein [unclassified Moorena]NEO13362.1 TldD/PmbA family protein [Moorena sp. SIO3E8]NEP99654.1 TldD/PmbA family protein [Moorena sp. SIO3F7]
MSAETIPQELQAEQLLDLAAKSGATSAEVYQSRSLSRPVFFEANRLKQIESSQSEGTALRLWRDGRPGLAVGYGAVAAQDLVDRAMAMTALNEPESIELADGPSANYSDSPETIPIEELVAMGSDAIALIRDAYPEVLCSAESEWESETTSLINSEGLHCSYTDTTLSYFLGVEWVRGEDFLSVGDSTEIRLSPSSTKESLNTNKVLEQILQRLNWATENVSTPSGRVPILLTSKAADLLWGTVEAALNGKRVLEKATPWSDSLGQVVTSKNLTLFQEPNPEFPYSCPFDDEGTPTQSLVFISEGQLQQFYCDRTTGRLLGTGTTGNGFRPSLGSYPTPDLVNLLIKPGQGSLNDLIGQLDEGLVIDQILGGSAGISGDFSVNVELGYRVQQGNIIGRVKDTMVAGNVYNTLKQLVVLGDDADWQDSIYTPSLIVEGLSVTSSH